MTKQIQKAGSKSNQTQIEHAIINVGVEEKRVREIFDEKISLITKELSSEATRIAQERINKLEVHLISKLKLIDNGFSSFTDPSFQIALIEAQKSAAITERDADFDILAELLVHRVRKAGNKKVKTGIKKAIEVVGDIDDDALLGLCLMYCVSNFTTSLTNLDDGLNEQDEFYGLLFYDILPSGTSWIHQLELLNLIRIDGGGSFIDLPTINLNKKPDEYIIPGILTNSDNHKKAIEIFELNGFNPNYLLIDHHFNTKYKILIDKTIEELNTQNNLKVISDNRYYKNNQLMEQKLKSCFDEVYNLYTDDITIKIENKKSFNDKWNTYTNLWKLNNWWDSLSLTFELTVAGKVLAHAHIMKIDKEFPEFNYDEM